MPAMAHFSGVTHTAAPRDPHGGPSPSERPASPQLLVPGSAFAGLDLRAADGGMGHPLPSSQWAKRPRKGPTEQKSEHMPRK